MADQVANKKENRLTGERSAYLRSASHQPVDWYPWGAEALERARKEDRPILLDIGAVWCHWCHVMDRESYESEEVAGIINKHFVPIKVDRDERPDIDARYQAAVSAISGQGGWPLTAFLTPEGKPFFGGTYFPPEDSYGRSGFKRILASIAANYQARRPEIEENAEKLMAALGKAEVFEGARLAVTPTIVDGIVESAAKLFDVRHGGFGAAPKFPHPATVELLLEQYQVNREPYLLTIISTTLDRMACGGMYDQLAGGFHRYSVDERWHVPHFEKMSYDNSELLKSYLHGYQVTGNPFYREIAEGIIGWVDATLSNRERGGFYASQDADFSLEDDGDYFTWTLREVRACLPPDEAELTARHYDIREPGDMHHNPAKNVLFLARSAEELARDTGESVEEIEQRLAPAKRKLLAARRERPTPYVDTSLYVSWNALFVSAYLEASQVLGRDDCRRQALCTLHRLRESAWSDRWGFAHRCHDKVETLGDEWPGGVLDDQVFMTHALLDAFELTGGKHYFQQAEQAMKICLEKYWDEKDGGFFDRPRGAPPIFAGANVARKPFQDSPTPGGNPVVAMALDRLYAYTLEEVYRDRARETLETFAGVAERYGLFASSYGLAVVLHVRQPLKVVIIGAHNDARTRALARAAREEFRFGKAVLHYEPQDVSAERLPAGLAVTLPHVGGEAPVALVCGNSTCQPPVSKPEDLAAALSGVSR